MTVKRARFKVDSALLEELGERLVSSSEVALTELVKNSYDADATECVVAIRDDEIVISDDGNGMSEADFLNLWMVVGTRNKASNPISTRYGRHVSGSKGIGRFAGRFLGEKMELKTISGSERRRVELSAVFDWGERESSGDLQTIVVPYRIRSVAGSVRTGTTIRISRLRTAVDRAARKKIYTNLLEIVNPLEGFEEPRFSKARAETRDVDPGFVPRIGTAEDEDSGEEAESPAKKILSAYVARARIEVRKSGSISIDLTWNRGEDEIYDFRTSLKELYGLPTLGTPALVDVRFFPQRGGVLQALGVNGKTARSWLTANCGVKVVDNGFRVKPYGDSDDDWLWQSSDKAKSTRNEWRSKLMRQQFSIANKALSPRDNPMLYLPGYNQAVGLVSLSTSGAKDDRESPAHLLTPAMDRQGFIENQGFRVLRDLARLALELVAYFDHKLVREEEDRLEQEALSKAEVDLKSAIRDIAQSKAIDPAEKARLTGLLKSASANYAEVDTYRKKAQQSLEVMSLLGVLAGFMTHEFEKTLFRVEEASRILKRLARANPELLPSQTKLDESRKYLETYVQYTKLFTSSLSLSEFKPFAALPQIELVIETLQPIADKHGIKFDIQASDRAEAPAIPVAAYSGLLLNLITNAMKALIARSDKQPRIIRIVAANTPTKHRLVVADTGIGITPRLRERIWEPLFSTSAQEGSPLGTGMGLGLAVVRRVATNLGGKVNLLDDPPAGFSTAFGVEIPRS